MSTQNPFDFSSMFTNFDPQAAIKQMQESFASASMPKFDAEGFASAQSKNVELFMNANKAVMENSQAVMQRQADMIQQAEPLFVGILKIEWIVIHIFIVTGKVC